MKCDECGHKMQLAEWPFCPHGQTNPYLALYGEPTIVHIDAKGNYRFAGAAAAPIPKGFHRVELRTMHDRERFEREVNKAERRRAQEHREREEMTFGGYKSQQRSDLRGRIPQMSPLGRDFAMTAIRMNDQRRKKTGDPGFHMEIVHFDSQNRPEYRDARTNWKSVRR